jgi:hypothetical protein
MMSEDAQPKREAAEAKAARQAASRASSQVAEPSPAAEGAEQSEVTSSRRYSTRGASGAGVAEGGVEEQGTQAASVAAATTPLAADPADSRRFSLRRLRTPMQMAHSAAAAAAAAGEAATPQQLPVLQGDDLPVEQDGSPQLRESPSFAATPLTGSGRYSLRASTLKKTRQGSLGSSPMAGASAGAALLAAEGSTLAGSLARKERQRAASPQLSPTEQGIRAVLRRSARKSSSQGEH